MKTDPRGLFFVADLERVPYSNQAKLVLDISR